MNFKFLVSGNHPVFAAVSRKCLTIEEAENVKEGLEAVGYEVTIQSIIHYSGGTKDETNNPKRILC